MKSEGGEKTGGGERYKQRERDVETKKGDFPEMPDNRKCYFEEGQVLWVVLVWEGGRRDGLPPPLGEGLIGGRQGYKEQWEGLRGSAGVINDESGV